MAKFIILKGLPGTGKTTVAEGLVEQGSTSAKIMTFTYPKNKTRLLSAYSTFYKRVSKEIDRSTPLIIVDAPNEDPLLYEDSIQKAGDCGYKVEVVDCMESDLKYFNTRFSKKTFLDRIWTLKYLRVLSKRSSKKPSTELMLYMAGRWKNAYFQIPR